LPPISQADLARFRGVRRSTREAPGPLSGSIRTMGDVTGVAVIWTRRCGSGPRDGAHAPADRRADASTMPAAGDRADYSPSAGAYQTAAHRPIGGIVRVREGRRRQHQSSADYACYGRLLCHSRSTEEARGVEPACWSACYRGPAQRAIQRDKQMARGCSSSRCRARSRLRPPEEACAQRATPIRCASAELRSSGGRSYRG
jgi:hypothetical protein